MNKSVLYDLSYGVYVVTTLDGERPTGCVANSVMQITSSPATVAVSLNHNNHTNGCVAKGGRFAVSVLAEETDPALIGRFGFQSGRDADKFEGLEHEVHSGMPIPKADLCGWMVCEVLDTLETETHTVFLAKVVDGEKGSGKTPMTYAYYHNVIKGKSPKNAPTYRGEEQPAAEKAVWKCSICGYVYEGETPFEELPDSYTCPICRQPKSVFKKEQPAAEKKVWKCSICGYVYEGETPFEELPDSYTCPICRQPKSVFKPV
ncbi:MAG: flavin reductase [Oscillospiraceae bacterium]|nr:flavin reductase [Oscillospiraceae bacterium]